MNFNLKQPEPNNYRYIDLKEWFQINYDNLPESIETDELNEPNLKNLVVNCIDGIDLIAHLGTNPKNVSLSRGHKQTLIKIYEALKDLGTIKLV